MAKKAKKKKAAAARPRGKGAKGGAGKGPKGSPKKGKNQPAAKNVYKGGLRADLEVHPDHSAEVYTVTAKLLGRRLLSGTPTITWHVRRKGEKNDLLVQGPTPIPEYVLRREIGPRPLKRKPGGVQPPNALPVRKDKLPYQVLFLDDPTNPLQVRLDVTGLGKNKKFEVYAVVDDGD